MDLLPILMLGGGAFMVLALMVFAFSGPSAERAGSRRLSGIKERNVVSAVGANAMESQLRRVSTARATRMDVTAARFLPNPAVLQKRLAMTGKPWTLSQYVLVSLGLTLVPTGLLVVQGAPIWLALALGLFVGLGLPHWVVGFFIKRRVAQFTAKFPDAIE